MEILGEGCAFELTVCEFRPLYTLIHAIGHKLPNSQTDCDRLILALGDVIRKNRRLRALGLCTYRDKNETIYIGYKGRPEYKISLDKIRQFLVFLIDAGRLSVREDS